MVLGGRARCRDSHQTEDDAGVDYNSWGWPRRRVGVGLPSPGRLQLRFGCPPVSLREKGWGLCAGLMGKAG